MIGVMTTIPPAAPAPGPAPVPDAVEPRRSGRAWLSGALVFVGGYLVLLSLNSQLVTQLAGFGSRNSFFAVLLLAQLGVAVVVVVVGLLSTPGPLAGRLVGALVVVVGVPVVAALLTLRVSGALRFGFEWSFTVGNQWLVTTLLVGAAWLLARGARLGWLSLLAVVVLSPAPYLLFSSGVDSGTVPLVMYPLTALAGAGILLAGRPWRD